MKTRRIPLAIAVAAALLTPTTAAFAAALGEVAALSALGERFRAEFRLVGGGTVQASCFRVVAPAESAAGIPALASGRVSIVGKGTNARLVVRDDRTVHDPVVQLALENVCETRLRREYTLLMPFTAANPVSAPVSAAPARKPATTRTAPAVQCTVAMWDVAGGTNQRGDVAAESVTGEGFELVFRTWSDTRIARLRVRWMAIGELAHADDWSV